MKKRLLFLIIGLCVYLPIIAYAYSSNSIPPATKTYVVQPGDTVWDIATREYPNKLTDEMVYQINHMNQIDDDGKLQVGEELNLP